MQEFNKCHTATGFHTIDPFKFNCPITCKKLMPHLNEVVEPAAPSTSLQLSKGCNNYLDLCARDVVWKVLKSQFFFILISSEAFSKA